MSHTSRQSRRFLSSDLDRRSFVTRSSAVAAAIAAAQSMKKIALSAEDALSTEDTAKPLSPNERLSVAVVGAGGRGQSHIQGFAAEKRTVVTHICDCDEQIGNKRCQEAAELQGGTKPVWVGDVRQLLEDKSIDLVSIATPNHWHSLGAIWALQAGKDVYVEKPVSHNVWEGRQLVIAAEKTGRVLQVGTQSRSNPGMRKAIEFIHQGKIGDIKIARGLCYKNRPSIGPKGEYPIPSNIDYDLWTGPAALKPLTRPRFHYDWHWQWEYGNGDLGNQGIHQMDLCRWALKKDKLADRVFSYGNRLGYEDAGETANTQVIVHDYGTQQLVFEVRGLKTDEYRGAKVGIIIEGSEGTLVMTSYENGVAVDKDGKVIERFVGGGDDHHYSNFVDAVLARDPSKVNASALEGHLSSALCHLGNISMRLGKQVAAREVVDYAKDQLSPEEFKQTLDRTLDHLTENGIDIDKATLQVGPLLEFNSNDETFKNNDQANAMLTREYRGGYEIVV